jgi:transposase
MPHPSTQSTVSEPVDDIPLLLTYFQRLGIQRLIDAHFEPAQPSAGLSLGWVAALWLAHILSQSGRSPRHIRSWITTHPETLTWLTGLSIRPSDLSDGRMREVLRALDDDTHWVAFESALNQHITRAYRLRPERIRLNRSSGLWYITSEGALQFDQSRRWWPGAMQIQLTVATLDPMSLPATVWVAASEYDAASALGAIAQTRAALPGRHVTFIGNGELGAPEVRAAIQAGHDAYICLLSNEEALASLRHALSGGWSLAGVQGADVPADAYERHESVRAELVGIPFEWRERRLLLRSHSQADEQAVELMSRLARAQRDLAALNEKKRGKRRPRTLVAMQEAVQMILEEHHVVGLIEVSYDEMVDQRTVRRYRGRPTTTRVERMVTVSSSVDEQALGLARERLGWQVYATTLNAEDLPIDQAIRTVGEAESAFERLRGRPLSLLPGVIQRNDHARGLVRLLGLGLRVLVLIDIAARARAADAPSMNWQRSGSQVPAGDPTAERLLEVFRDITLTTILDGGTRRHHLTALSALQRRVIDWLALPPDTYQISDEA